MKNKMKYSYLAFAGVLALGSIAQAQTLPPVDDQSRNYKMLFQNIGASGAYIDCNNPSGKCSYEVPTIIKNRILDQIQKASEITQKRYADIFDTAKNSLDKLVAAAFKKDGLVDLSKRTQGGNTTTVIDMQSLYQAYADYQEAYLTVENNFSVMAAFFDGDDMSIPIEDQSIIKEIPTKAAGTIEPLKKVFWKNLRNVNTTLCRLKFNIQYPNDTAGYGVNALACDAQSETNLDADPSKTTIPTLAVHWQGMQFDQATIDKLLAQLREYRKPTPGVADAVQKLGNATLDAIKSFIEIFGVKQRAANRMWDWWPFFKNSMTHANDIKIEAEEENYENLITAFWARSAMRFTSGLPVGAFDINYQQDPHNWDILKTRVEALSSIPTGMIFSQTGEELGADGQPTHKNATVLLQEASLKYRYALNTSESKAAILANSDKTKTKNLVLESEYTGVIDIGNSLKEVFNGKVETWKALNLVLQLMAADLYEEQVLRQPGGMKKLMKMYANRYQRITNPDKRKKYHDLALQFQNAIEGRPDKKDDGDLTSDTNYQSDSDIRGLIMRLSQETNGWTARISQGRVYQVQLDFAYDVANSKDFEKKSKRSKML